MSMLAAQLTTGTGGAYSGESAIGGAPPPVAPKPSHKLCLKNLLDDAALTDDTEFNECTEDIKEECARFGTLVSCVFPRASDLGGYTEADVGSCFVHYELMSAAVRAQHDLDGRDFDSRKVIATFVYDDEAAPSAP